MSKSRLKVDVMNLGYQSDSKSIRNHDIGTGNT